MRINEIIRLEEVFDMIRFNDEYHERGKKVYDVISKKRMLKKGKLEDMFPVALAEAFGQEVAEGMDKQERSGILDLVKDYVLPVRGSFIESEAKRFSLEPWESCGDYDEENDRYDFDYNITYDLVKDDLLVGSVDLSDKYSVTVRLDRADMILSELCALTVFLAEYVDSVADIRIR